LACHVYRGVWKIKILGTLKKVKDSFVNSPIPTSCFFDLLNNNAYERWRDQKLNDYPQEAQSLLVEMSDFYNPSDAEITALRERISKTNMALYASTVGKGEDVGRTKRALSSLGLRLGLKALDANLCADEDNYSVLSVSEGARRSRYIPYTNKPINWHTDGYYNAPDLKIKGMGLHCISPAAAGGENALMDPEIVYILLRDENPDFVHALMHPHAMEIPPNNEGGDNIREAQSGPVFSLFGDDATLHMRYTARTRSIKWREDELTTAAVTFLGDLLNSDSPYIFRHRMAAGEGVLCNNVLHNRTGFEDDKTQQRSFLRARYFDRITS
jgi:hypothetical protein